MNEDRRMLSAAKSSHRSAESSDVQIVHKFVGPEHLPRSQGHEYQIS